MASPSKLALENQPPESRADSPRRPTVLTVDDAKAVRSIAERVLGAFVCEACGATNGFEAFFAIERARPDLILLDVSMPIMGGVETLRRLKSTPELAAIPVIMLTSPADHAVTGQLVALGATGILMKPFTETALLEKIRRVLALRPVA